LIITILLNHEVIKINTNNSITVLDKEKKIDITCYWNKNAIIEMIKTDEQKFNIPKKYEPLIPSTWNFDKHRITVDSYRDDYLSMSSKLYNASFEFKYNDLIRLIDGNIYM
jgi:hypothetical protein